MRRALLVTSLTATLVALLALSGCGGADAARREAVQIPSPSPSPTPSATLLPPYQATAQYAEAAAQATMSAGRVAQMQAGMTATAAALSMFQAQATQAHFATATAQALRATATAQALATRRAEAQATATAQAIAMAGTATAQALQATATVHALTVSGTATAQAMSLAGTATARAERAAAQATQAAVMAQATAQAAAAEREVLALEQQRMLNQAWGLARFLLAVGGALLVMGLVAWAVVQWQRYRVVRVAADKVLVRLGNGWYDPERNPYPIASVGPNGQPTLPKLPPDEMQERTAARAQYVDLTRAMPTGRRPRRPRLPVPAPEKTREPAPRVHFRVLHPREAGRTLPALLPPETAQVLEAEWREASPEQEGKP